MLPEMDETRMGHMRQAGRDALEFAAGRLRADLDTDKQLGFALVRAIEIIGEAASQVSPEGRDCCDLPWPQIVGMRHRIVHAYYDINLDRVWETVEDYIPTMLVELERVLPPEADD